jgi:SAM-dependent methyltransferase
MSQPLFSSPPALKTAPGVVSPRRVAGDRSSVGGSGLPTCREETRGPMRRLKGDRLVPNPERPASLLAQALLQEGLAAVASHVSGRLLDVGCGEKPYEWLYGSRVTHYVGCDWLGTVHGSYHLDLFADAACLPFRDAMFDTVLCTEVLEHLPQPERCLSELRRVLCPGGKLILSVPFLCWLHEQPHDYYRYTLYGLEHLARQCRLEPIAVYARGDLIAVGIDLWSKWLMHLLRRASAMLPLAGWIPAAGAAVVQVPQRAYLQFRALARRFGMHESRLLLAMTMADVAALGYVLVARRAAPEDGAGTAGRPTVPVG